MWIRKVDVAWRQRRLARLAMRWDMRLQLELANSRAQRLVAMSGRAHTVRNGAVSGRIRRHRCTVLGLGALLLLLLLLLHPAVLEPDLDLPIGQPDAMSQITSLLLVHVLRLREDSFQFTRLLRTIGLPSFLCVPWNDAQWINVRPQVPNRFETSGLIPLDTNFRNYLDTPSLVL